MILNEDPLPTIHKALLSVMFSVLAVPAVLPTVPSVAITKTTVSDPVSLGAESANLHTTVFVEEYQPASGTIQGRESTLPNEPNKTLIEDLAQEPASVETAPVGDQPTINETGLPRMTLVATVTAYNTLESQTDGSPCIAASGDDICGRDDVVACPRWIPLRTTVTIQEKDYVCLDRTAAKYNERFDISYDKDYHGALEFGKRQLSVMVYLDK